MEPQLGKSRQHYKIKNRCELSGGVSQTFNLFFNFNHSKVRIWILSGYNNAESGFLNLIFAWTGRIRWSYAGVEEMVEGTDFFQRIQSDISQFYSSPRQPEAGPNSWCQTISHFLISMLGHHKPICACSNAKNSWCLCSFLRLFTILKLNYKKNLDLPFFLLSIVPELDP